MSYPRSWRLSPACDPLVSEPDLGLEGPAARVGSGSGFAFSVAFKRHVGTSPSGYHGSRTRGTRTVGVW